MTIAVGAPALVLSRLRQFPINGIGLSSTRGAALPTRSRRCCPPSADRERACTFGWSVALARNGTTNTLVVGAPGVNSNDGQTLRESARPYIYTGRSARPTPNAATLAASDRAAVRRLRRERRRRDLRRHDGNRGRRAGTGNRAAREGIPLHGLRFLLCRDEADGLPGRLAAARSEDSSAIGVGVVFAAGKPVVAVGDYGKQIERYSLSPTIQPRASSSTGASAGSTSRHRCRRQSGFAVRPLRGRA